MSFDSQSLDSLRIDRSTEPSSPGEERVRRRHVVWSGAAILIVLAVAAWSFNRPPPVEAMTVRAIPSVAVKPRASGVLNASGYVVARRMATVSSKVTGRVVEVLIEEGNSVEKGQLLARLDGAMARAAADLARRELEVAKLELAEVEIRLGDAERNLERMQTLRARSLVSEAALDAARVESRALSARLAVAKAQAQVFASSVEVELRDLADLDIHAPFAGVVISKDAQPGETVSPVSGGGAFTRTGIATIVDMESLEIEVDVNEAYIGRVMHSQRVEATLDAYPNDPLPARVVNIVPTANRQKATVNVRIAFEKLEPRILPDMGIKVRFLDDSPRASPAQKPRAVQAPYAAAPRRDGDS